MQTQVNEFSFILKIHPNDELELKKMIIDKSPNEKIHDHMKNAIKQQDYELCSYIKDVACARGLKLN